MREVSIHRYGTRIGFVAHSFSMAGYTTLWGPCIVADASEADTRLGEVFREVLTPSVPQSPPQSPEEALAEEKRFPSVLGAKSWDSIGRSGASCSVDQDGALLNFIPERYKGRGVFVGVGKLEFTIAADSPPEVIGAAVRTALRMPSGGGQHA